MPFFPPSFVKSVHSSRWAPEAEMQIINTRPKVGGIIIQKTPWERQTNQLSKRTRSKEVRKMSDYRCMHGMLDEYQASSDRKSTAKESPFTVTKYSKYFGINSMQDVCDRVEKTIILVIPAGEQKENCIFLASRSNIVKISTLLVCRSHVVQLLIQRIWLCRKLSYVCRHPSKFLLRSWPGYQHAWDLRKKQR